MSGRYWLITYSEWLLKTKVCGLCVSSFLSVNHLSCLTGTALLVVKLQDPDGGNDADEEQKNGRRKPVGVDQHNVEHVSKVEMREHWGSSYNI